MRVALSKTSPRIADLVKTQQDQGAVTLQLVRAITGPAIWEVSYRRLELFSGTLLNI